MAELVWQNGVVSGVLVARTKKFTYFVSEASYAWTSTHDRGHEMLHVKVANSPEDARALCQYHADLMMEDA